jgi:hypothetical protein
VSGPLRGYRETERSKVMTPECADDCTQKPGDAHEVVTGAEKRKSEAENGEVGTGNGRTDING